jgi:hypothetical protein
MQSKEDIEALAYDIWQRLTDNSPYALGLALMGGGSLLALLLWVLEKDCTDDQTLLLGAVDRGKKNIADDCIEDPIGMIVRDLSSRREASNKARTAQDN